MWDFQPIGDLGFFVVEDVAVGLAGFEFLEVQDDFVLAELVRILVLPDLLAFRIEQPDLDHTTVGDLVIDMDAIAFDFVSFETQIRFHIMAFAFRMLSAKLSAETNS